LKFPEPPTVQPSRKGEKLDAEKNTANSLRRKLKLETVPS